MSTVFSFGQGLSKVVPVVGTLGLAIAKLTSYAIGLSKVFASTGKELLHFVTITGQGAAAAKEFKAAYSEVLEQSGRMVVSLDEAAKTMAEFSKQGYLQLRMSKNMTSGMIALQNTLAKGAGRALGKEILQGLQTSFKTATGSFNAMLSEMQTGGSTLQSTLKGLSDRGRGLIIDPLALEATIGALNNLRDIAAGTADKSVYATLKMDQLAGQWEALGNEVKQALITMLGGPGLEGIDALQDKIQSMIETLQDFQDAPATGAWNAWSKMARNMLPDWAKRGSSSEDAQLAAMEKAQRTNKRLKEKQAREAEFKAKTAAEAASKVARVEEAGLNNVQAINLIVAKTEQWRDQLEIASGSMQTIADLTAQMGGDATIGSEALRDLVNESADNAIALANQVLAAATPEAIAKIRVEMEKLQASKATALTKMLDPNLDEGVRKQTEDDLVALNAGITKQTALYKGVADSQTAIQKAIEAKMAPEKANIDLLKTQQGLLQSNLNIIQATYGVAGLSVSAQMQIVENLQKQKEQAQAMYDTFQAEKAKLTVSEGLVWVKKREAELAKDIADKTAEQLNQLKELRDGYLDAVQAQAFGAGRFEKIIMTQEKNTAKALDNRIAKENYLLGAISTKALASRVSIGRFASGGYGMEQLGGGALDVEERQRQAMKNAVGPGAKEAMEASLKLSQGGTNLSGYDQLIINQIKSAGIAKGAAGQLVAGAMVQGAMSQPGIQRSSVSQPSITPTSSTVTATATGPISNMVKQSTNLMMKAAVMMDEVTQRNNSVPSTRPLSAAVP